MELATLRYVPVLSEADPADAWARPHRAGAPRGDGTICPTSGAPGLRLRRADLSVELAQRDFIARCGLPDDEFYADSFTSEADKHGP